MTGRLARHHALSRRLAALDDDAVADLLETASSTSVGIGGTTASPRIDDVAVGTVSGGRTRTGDDAALRPP